MPRPVDLAVMIERWHGYLLEWALVLAAVATMTMALLELLKVITAARRWFHQSSVKSWLREERTFHELEMLAVGGGGSANALFDQPTDKMMGQIQAASNTALDFPTRYPALYDFLTAQPGTETQTPDESIWREFCATLESGKQLNPDDAESAAMVSAATRARARLDHFVARRLDAFQTVTEYRWARANQIVSVIGAAIFLLILISSAAGGGITWRIVIVSLFGGMMAPLAKDLASALSDLRVRR